MLQWARASATSAAQGGALQRFRAESALNRCSFLPAFCFPLEKGGRVNILGYF